MRSYFALEPADLAQHYVLSKGDPSFLPGTAAALVADVERYLQANGLGHRQEDAVEIAQAAFELARQAMAQTPPATPAEPEFRAQVEGGTTATDADLARYVAGLDMRSYSAERERLGTYKGLPAFLGGN